MGNETEAQSRTGFRAFLTKVSIDLRTWRTVDIVVAAVIGVSVGVVFWLWNILWTATGPLFVAFPPAQAVIYGMWMISGVLGALVIRRPGAAVLTAIAAALVSAILGTQWGFMVIIDGTLQGILPELVFLAFAYRRWTMGVAVLAAMAAGLSPAIKDNILWNVTWPLSYQIAYGVIVVVSSGVIAGVGARVLTTALAKAGALTPFPSARD